MEVHFNFLTVSFITCQKPLNAFSALIYGIFLEDFYTMFHINNTWEPCDFIEVILLIIKGHVDGCYGIITKMSLC